MSREFQLLRVANKCYCQLMSAIESVLDDLRHFLLRHLPGLTVLSVVMILLRGSTGSIEAIKSQVATLATSFLGGGEGLLGVLVYILPLAIVAAIATFAIANRMITFESQLSILALAGIAFWVLQSADLPSEGIGEPVEFRHAA